jgi:general secretion pathway protein F
MAFEAAPFPQRVTLEDLVALNDEILLLARSGVPLESGLTAAATELPERVQQLATALGTRLANGEPVDRVLDAHRHLFPAVYRAVLESGLRSGCLPKALESLSLSLRRIADLAGIVRLAVIYPLVLAAAAWLLFVMSVVFILPTTLPVYADVSTLPAWFLSALRFLVETVRWWGAIPLALLLVCAAWLLRPGVRCLTAGGAGLPFARQLAADGRLATFAEILALLLRSETPLDRALLLAGEACGDPDLGADANRLAEAVLLGRRELPPPGARGLPALVRAVLLSARQPDQLARVVSRQAHVLRLRAQQRARRLSGRLPVMLAVGCGGVCVALYALWTLFPWYWLVFQLLWNAAG